MTDEQYQPSRLFAEDAAGLPQLPDDYPRPGRGVPSSMIGGRATNWRTMTDEQAPDEWEALRDWTEWFVRRYRVPESTVPPCWYRHGQLVEELSALHCAHRAAFDPSDSGNGPIGWHERLALALPRMSKVYAGGCSNGHREHPSRPWPKVATEEEWDAWIRQSHAH
jgi:hypothetical protein